MTRGPITTMEITMTTTNDTTARTIVTITIASIGDVIMIPATKGDQTLLDQGDTFALRDLSQQGSLGLNQQLVKLLAERLKEVSRSDYKEVRIPIGKLLRDTRFLTDAPEAAVGFARDSVRMLHAIRISADEVFLSWDRKFFARNRAWCSRWLEVFCEHCQFPTKKALYRGSGGVMILTKEV